MKKILLAAVGLLTFPAFADCRFVIANLTNFNFTVQMGFYNGAESTIVVPPTATFNKKIKGPLQCNSSSIIGTGVSYISFPNDPNGGGVNYSPSTGNINFMGEYSGSSSSAYIRADNGQKVLMDGNSNGVDDKTFTIRLNFIGRPNSKSAGTI